MTGRPWLVLGGGGHARVVVDLLLACRAVVRGLVVAGPDAGTGLRWGVPVVGTDDDVLAQFERKDVLVANGIGSVGDPTVRVRVFARYRDAGFEFPPLMHPFCSVASGVETGDGLVVMAGAVIQSGSRLGTNVVVNTAASVDHDCDIGDDVHVAPGAIVCGDVTLGRRVHVGAGAVVVQGRTVGEGALIGAGAVVVRDVGPGERVVGVPARAMRAG